MPLSRKHYYTVLLDRRKAVFFMRILLHPEVIHKFRHQLLPVSLAVTAAHLAADTGIGPTGEETVGNFLIPVIALAGGVLAPDIGYAAVGLFRAPGEVDPGIGVNGHLLQFLSDGTHADADGTGDTGGLGEGLVAVQGPVQGHQTAHAGLRLRLFMIWLIL